jgi:hypothetical protein
VKSGEGDQREREIREKGALEEKYPVFPLMGH